MKNIFIFSFLFLLISCANTPQETRVNKQDYLKNFYDVLPLMLEYNDIHQFLAAYDSVLLNDGYIDTLSGKAFTTHFQEMYETQSLTFPMFADANQVLFDLKKLRALINEFTPVVLNGKTENNSRFYKILLNYKKLQNKEKLNAAITSKFFLDSFTEEMWEQTDARHTAYLFYFLQTTIISFPYEAFNSINFPEPISELSSKNTKDGLVEELEKYIKTNHPQ